MKTEQDTRFRLGVTGGIGSGKTSVCRVFNVLNIPVFSADREAREIMDNEVVIKEAINNLTGRDMYRYGTLNRSELAAIIFNDCDMLRKVDSLVHPVVFEHFAKWTLSQTSPYVIMEAAILFESGASEYVDRVATVIAPISQRIARVIRRNKLTEDQVLERMRNQMDDETRMKMSDYVIPNSEDDMIIPVILKIHEDILSLIKSEI